MQRLWRVLGVLGVVTAAAWAAWKWWPRPAPAPGVAWLNTRLGVGYVGDAACADCHGDVAEKYRHHPMGQSLAPVANDHTPADASFTSVGFRLSAERRGAIMIHAEKLLDAAGKPVVETSAEVRFVCGSGQQGTSYLIDRGGLLFLSPIAWYRNGGWKPSPGYEQGTLHFDRPVTFACLNCHSNRPLHVAGSENRYREPIFEGQSIGCERCHGPGELHVARRKQGDVSLGLDETIVNPARLASALRDSVCEQCHLQGEARVVRRGKSREDYRPGLPLSDFLAVYVRPPELTQGRRALNHVEQMEVSRCRDGSGGKLGCISCHDPHALPAEAERVTHYRNRCLQCHADAGCRLPQPERLKQNPADSCIDCHMPRSESANIAHMAVTDHRIVRRPGYHPPTPERLRPTGEFPVILFHGHLPGARGDDERRNLGLMAAEMATRPGPERVQRMIAARAEPMLRQAVTDVGNDIDALEALGTVLTMQGRASEAVAVFDRALALTPERASLLEAAALADPTPERWRRYLAVAPMRPRGHFHLAEALAAHKDWPAAIVACRESLRLDATHVPARTLLAKALREIGDIPATEREQNIIRELEKAAPRAP